MNRVILLPCDTRPPTLELPHQLAKVAGLEMTSPPLDILNKLNKPGNVNAIADWFRREAAYADVAIVTLETLALGGMIPARRITDSLDKALQRLEVIREVKTQNPDLRILAYGVIVRVGHDNDPLEEKPYYGTWGNHLRKVSELMDKVERGMATERELDHASVVVPRDVLNDWLDTRRRNHAVHAAAIEMLADGTLEHLCLTLDDTTPFGLAALDRRRLEAKLDDLGLWTEADTYPGADEVAATLLARALVNSIGRKPKVFVRYPATNAEQAVMLYEDRPLGELVKAHLRAAGCVPASTPEEADLIFAVNAPAVRQAHHQPDLEQVDTAGRNLPEFFDRLVGDVAAARLVTVADVAYANGADHRFTKLLLAALNPTTLAGYAAWNTAGNTLGSAIAAGVCALYNRDPIALAEANYARLLDDWLYQSIVRGQVRDKLSADIGQPVSPFDLGDLQWGAELEINRRIEPLAKDLFERHFAPNLPGIELEWNRPRLAWPRLFTGVFPARFVSPVVSTLPFGEEQAIGDE
jgi:hypothetical protein